AYRTGVISPFEPWVPRAGTSEAEAFAARRRRLVAGLLEGAAPQVFDDVDRDVPPPPMAEASRVYIFALRTRQPKPMEKECAQPHGKLSQHSKEMETAIAVFGEATLRWSCGGPYEAIGDPEAAEECYPESASVERLYTEELRGEINADGLDRVTEERRLKR